MERGKPRASFRSAEIGARADFGKKERDPIGESPPEQIPDPGLSDSCLIVKHKSKLAEALKG